MQKRWYQQGVCQLKKSQDKYRHRDRAGQATYILQLSVYIKFLQHHFVFVFAHYLFTFFFFFFKSCQLACVHFYFPVLEHVSTVFASFVMVTFSHHVIGLLFPYLCITILKQQIHSILHFCAHSHYTQYIVWCHHHISWSWLLRMVSDHLLTLVNYIAYHHCAKSYSQISRFTPKGLL